MPREIPPTLDVASKEAAITRQPERASQIQPASKARLSSPQFRAQKSHAARPIPKSHRLDRKTLAPDSGVKSVRETNGRDRLLTPKEAAKFLNLSNSWLSKARMSGDGPPFLKLGRSIRYSEEALRLWIKSRQRLSTSEK